MQGSMDPRPPEEVLVHRPPLLLLDQILEANEEGCLARIRVDGSAWYADGDGSMPGWFGIELMAQTASAYSGAKKVEAGLAPRIGYLLGAQRYACEMPSFPAGSLLEIRARLQYLDETGLSAFACEIRCDGEPAAHATLKAFEPQ